MTLSRVLLFAAVFAIGIAAAADNCLTWSEITADRSTTGVLYADGPTEARDETGDCLRYGFDSEVVGNAASPSAGMSPTWLRCCGHGPCRDQLANFQISNMWPKNSRNDDAFLLPVVLHYISVRNPHARATPACDALEYAATAANSGGISNFVCHSCLDDGSNVDKTGEAPLPACDTAAFNALTAGDGCLVNNNDDDPDPTNCNQVAKVVENCSDADLLVIALCIVQDGGSFNPADCLAFRSGASHLGVAISTVAITAAVTMLV